jgi:hypothetical protein
MDLSRINLFLIERKLTTKVEFIKAERELKIAKGKDAGIDLYPDFTKFLAIYLNGLKSKDLAPYRIINKKNAEELVTQVTSSHPNMQAVLDKLNLDPKGFVSRFWTKMGMKSSIQDAIKMLLKGEKDVIIKSGEEPVVTESKEKSTTDKKKKK